MFIIVAHHCIRLACSQGMCLLFFSFSFFVAVIVCILRCSDVSGRTLLHGLWSGGGRVPGPVVAFLVARGELCLWFSGFEACHGGHNSAYGRVVA